MIFTLLLFILLLFGLILHDFVPAISWAYHSHLHPVSVIFFACAISVPFPVMLLFAFFTGFIWDFKNLTNMPEPDVVKAAWMLGVSVPKGGGTFGFTIFLLGVLGSLMQGIRPLFRRGKWFFPVLMCGLGTFLLLIGDYLWINFRRGGFYFPREIWYYILATAALSTFVAPFVFYLIDRLANLSGYHIRYEGLAQRRWQS
jgi:hypothetical protein